jgi:hypothetical protein
MRELLAMVIAVVAMQSVFVGAQVRAAGMALKDGALPPGTLTVRVVRGGFSNNLANQVVTLEVSGGPSQRARTGEDGRATFPHLPVGARVRAFTTVEGEPLESETFEMPGESGIRILFIGGEASVDAAASGPAPVHPVTPSVVGQVPVPSLATSGATDEPAPATSIAAIKVVWVAVTLVMGVYVSRPWWRPRSRSRTAEPSSAD